MRRPGNRRKYWNLSCELAIFQHLFCAVVFWFLFGGSFGKGVAGICIFMAVHSIYERVAGWKLSNKRPPWADRAESIDRKWKVGGDDE